MISVLIGILLVLTILILRKLDPPRPVQKTQVLFKEGIAVLSPTRGVLRNEEESKQFFEAVNTALAGHPRHIVVDFGKSHWGCQKLPYGVLTKLIIMCFRGELTSLTVVEPPQRCREEFFYRGFVETAHHFEEFVDLVDSLDEAMAMVEKRSNERAGFPAGIDQEP